MTTLITVAPVPAGPVAEVLRAVRAAADIGASVVDVPADPELVAALRAETDLVVRAADVVQAADGVRAGEVVRGAEVVGCPMDDWSRAESVHTARQAVPVYEVTTVAQLKDVQRLLDQHGLPYGGRVHCDLRGLSTVPGLAAMLDALPAGASFTASGEGPAALPMVLAALAAGGHLRVPLTDSPRDNAQLVARAAGLARIAQRPPASPAQARALLGVRS